MDLALRKFDLSKIGKESTVVLVGKRRSGKSVLTKDLMYHMRHIPIGTVISGTEDVNPFFSDAVPSICIHNEYRPEIVVKVIERQKAVVTKWYTEVKTVGTSSIDPHSFLIMDDCLFDASWTKDTVIRYLFMNGRHLKILLLITMQYAMGIGPVLRTNVDYVFIFRENIMQNRKRLYECYAGMFPTFEAFCSVMDQCTENFECLVIVNGAASNKLEEQVFWYKAEVHGPFKVCSPSVWELSERQKAAGEGGRGAAYDPSGFKKKSSGPALTVRKTH